MDRALVIVRGCSREPRAGHDGLRFYPCKLLLLPCVAVFLLNPEYWAGHSERYLYLLPKKYIFIGSKFPRRISPCLENSITVAPRCQQWFCWSWYIGHQWLCVTRCITPLASADYPDGAPRVVVVVVRGCRREPITGNDGLCFYRCKLALIPCTSLSSSVLFIRSKYWSGHPNRSSQIKKLFLFQHTMYRIKNLTDVSFSFENEITDQQWCWFSWSTIRAVKLFSRNIAKVTPKMMYFYYNKKKSGSKYPNRR